MTELTDEEVQELLDACKIVKNGKVSTGLIGESVDRLGIFPHKGAWYFGWLPPHIMLAEVG